LPQPTIGFGLRLQTSAAPYGQTKFPTSVLGDSDRLLTRHSLGDYLGFRHGLYLFWSWFLLLQTGVRHSSKPSIHFGPHLFAMGFHLSSVSIHFGGKKTKLGFHPGHQMFQHLFHLAWIHLPIN
jgi:hypothetical protein